MESPKPAKQSLKVLIVDDDELSYEMACFALRKNQFFEFDIQWLSSASNALHAMVNNLFDVYLVDYRLGADDGIELTRLAKLDGCKRPVIIITGFEDPTTDARSLNAGADAFVSKDMLNTPFLERALRYAVTRDQVHRSFLEQQLEYVHEFRRSALSKMAIAIGNEINEPFLVLSDELQKIQTYLQKSELSRDVLVAKVTEIQRNAARIEKIIRALNQMPTQKILVVDDDADIAELMTSELENAGYSVATATDGLKALELLKDTTFDVLISDIVMPGIRGDELFIRASKAGVLPSKVFGITGYGTLTLPHPARSSQIKLLHKPFAMQELLSLVQENNLDRVYADLTPGGRAATFEPAK